MTTPQPDVRGTRATKTPAPPLFRRLAFALDLGIATVLYFLLHIAFRSIPIPGASFFLYWAVFTAIFWSWQRFFFGTTLGERAWKIHTLSRWTLVPELRQHPLGPSFQSFGIFLTVSSFVIALLAAQASVVLNPIGMRAQSLDWQAFFPGFDPTVASTTGSESVVKDRWGVMPFFYALGAWPQNFQGRAVFLNLPYEKGPPERFAGEISARWSDQVRVLFEGPKSPLSPNKELYHRDEIEDCIVEPWARLATIPRCLILRKQVLSRHVEALRRLHPSHWEMSWVQVQNRAIEPDQQLQGIYLSAHNDRRGEDRFVMITAKGTHQTFVLHYPMNDEEAAARKDFTNAMKSVRVSDELSPGRIWVDQRLEQVNLRDIDQLGDSPDAIQKLAEIQGLLVARVSVDPKTYDTYFHLAGTALMLARAANRLKQQPAPKGNPALGAEILSYSRPIIQAAQKYAFDVAPAEKRNALVEKFWAESQKF